MNRKNRKYVDDMIKITNCAHVDTYHIDDFQDLIRMRKLELRLDVLEKKLKISEISDPPDKPECKECGGQIDGRCCMHFGQGKPDPDKPERERICDQCGGKFGKTCYHMGISKPDPSLPLNAQVAQALGEEVFFNNISGHKGWLHKHPKSPFPIPDYRDDLTAAARAFHEYLEKNKLMFKMICTNTGQGYIGIGEIKVSEDIFETSHQLKLYPLEGETLAENFCHAIVNHHEWAK